MCHLHDSVLPVRETPQRCQEVDVSALDKLLLCLAELLLSLSTPEQGHPCRQRTDKLLKIIHIYVYFHPYY